MNIILTSYNYISDISNAVLGSPSVTKLTIYRQISSSEYRNACLIALMETWLKQQDLQSYLETNGFGGLLQLDRNPAVTGKSLEGVCLLIKTGAGLL